MATEFLKKDGIFISLTSPNISEAFSQARLKIKETHVEGATVVELELKSMKQTYAITGDVTAYDYHFIVEWY
jgi:hypothetical protein